MKKTHFSTLDIPLNHSFLARGQTYVLPKGKVGEKDHLKRLYLCWQKTEDGIYYVCGCGRINRMSANLTGGISCGLFMDGSMVGTYGCEYCYSCKSHIWYVLEDFPVKVIQKKIVKNPRQCPMCGLGNLFDETGFKACGRCYFRWRLPKKPVQTEVLHVDQRG